MWRLVLSPRLGVSLAELHDRWTIADTAEAHEALDIAEDYETAARARLAER